MKRFADSLARQKGIKPPPGYKTSISICSAFLKEHAPKKAESETIGKLEPKPVSPAQLLYATKIAQGKGLIIPDEAKANSAAMSAWIDSNRGTKRRTRGRKTAYKPVGSAAPQSAAPTKKTRNRKAGANASQSTPAQPNSIAGTPLRIPYGNKDVAMKLGARYGSAGWYAPPGVLISLHSASGDGYNPANDVRGDSLIFCTAQPRTRHSHQIRRPLSPEYAPASLSCVARSKRAAETPSHLGHNEPLLPAHLITFRGNPRHS